MFVKNLGHFSQTSKMPCPSYSMSAFDCITTDEICKKICYAKRHHYNFKNVKDALAKNKILYLNKEWSNKFCTYIRDILDLKFFRWFDSGDMPNIIMMIKLGEIADQCPDIKFWLPTRRKDLLIAYYEANNQTKLSTLHPNLIIRLSGKDIDKDPNYTLASKLGVNVSSVTTSKKIYTCKASDQGGKCLQCRKCWTRKIKEVRYLLH